MKISAKVRATIEDNINTIRSNSFTERDIKELLIDGREYFSRYSPAKELSHFIAHPERNSGDYHTAFSLNAAAIKIQTPNPFTNKPFIDVDFYKLPKKLYDLFFIYGISKIDEKLFVSNLGMSKAGALKYLSTSYAEEGACLILKKESRIKRITKIGVYCISWISIESVFSSQKITKSLDDNFRNIYLKYFRDSTYKPVFASRHEDVIICIASLLQDSFFKLFDDTMATMVLCKIDYSKKQVKKPELALHGVIELLPEDDSQSPPFKGLYIQSNYLSTGIELEKYFSKRLFSGFRGRTASVLPLSYTVRDQNNKLRLVPYLHLALGSILKKPLKIRDY